MATARAPQHRGAHDLAALAERRAIRAHALGLAALAFSVLAVVLATVALAVA